MNEKNLNDKTAENKIDVADKVMDQIRSKDIRMKSPLFFLAEKIGLQSVLALLVLGGALAVSTILYILKKTGTLPFLKLGFPGLKVFLYSLPYDYIALLLVAVLLGNYIVRQLDFSHGVRSYFDVPAAALLVVVFFLGAFFAVMGGEQFFKGLYTNRAVAKDIALTGKVVSASDGEVTIQESDGQLEKIVFAPGKPFPYTPQYATGKILRAVGSQDPQNPSYFHADDISCCDSE
jgi:hypothetical protein